MNTYVIGDIHGCYDTLQALLSQIEFNPATDRIWSVGDLINRGPRSLDVLRWAQSLGDRFTSVLGNHELHLLCCVHGLREPSERDTLTSILNAPDREALIDWVCRRPLLHYEPPWLMVHAGLLPQWTLEQALGIAAQLARELQQASSRAPLLRDWQAARKEANVDPTVPHPIAPTPTALTALTCLRVCDRQGRIHPSFTGPLCDVPEGYAPWFEVAQQPWRDDLTILCGHWSALGYHQAPGLIALDSGCHWGRALTALRLEDRQLFTQPFIALA